MEEKHVLKMYFEEFKSLPEIAEYYDTYSNKIRRIILKSGKQLRSKAESQKIALEKGRAEHPTEGKQRSESTKLKLSEASAKAWENKSEKEKKQIRKKISESWHDRDPNDVADMLKKAAQAVSEAGRTGSKLENYLVEKLNERGYNVIAHKKGVIPNSSLEPDILVPGLKILIEIDGPSHFFPIFGKTKQERQERLEKTIAADNVKNGLFLQEGFCVIRVKHICKTLSGIKKRKALEDIIAIIEKVRKNHKNTIIDVEV